MLFSFSILNWLYSLLAMIAGVLITLFNSSIPLFLSFIQSNVESFLSKTKTLHNSITLLNIWRLFNVFFNESKTVFKWKVLVL